MSELELFLSDEFRASVEANLGRDPLAVALDGRVPNAAAVATQVKYLQRAREKLSAWYSARCIFPGRAFEQSSGQAAALRRHPTAPVSATGVALDLTCGLGVDSWALSRRFARVVAVERDPFLAAVARENFRRLGVDNVLVINDLAENFCRNTTQNLRDSDDKNGETERPFDLVYVDPDRRSADGRKQVRLSDCSPDLSALLPDIQRLTPRLTVKLSPLFDVAEAVRIFGPGTCVEVVSVGDECKEIVANVAFGVDRPSMVRAVAIGLGEAEYPFSDDPTDGDGAQSENVARPDWSSASDPFEPDRYRFLVVPDVALQKSRLAVRYFRERGVWIDDNNGYGFAVDRPTDVIGKVIDIQRVEPFDPKALRRRLRSGGVKNADILKRNFPLSTDQLRRSLGLAAGRTKPLAKPSIGKSGGATLRLAFTSVADRLWQIWLS